MRDQMAWAGAKWASVLAGAFLLLTSFLFPRTPAGAFIAWITGVVVVLAGFTRSVLMNAVLAVWVISTVLIVRPATPWTALSDEIVGLVLLTAAVLRARPSPRMPA